MAPRSEEPAETDQTQRSRSSPSLESPSAHSAASALISSSAPSASCALHQHRAPTQASLIERTSVPQCGRAHHPGRRAALHWPSRRGQSRQRRCPARIYWRGARLTSPPTIATSRRSSPTNTMCSVKSARTARPWNAGSSRSSRGCPCRPAPTRLASEMFAAWMVSPSLEMAGFSHCSKCRARPSNVRFRRSSNESARYNLAPAFQRNINFPTFALSYLRRAVAENSKWKARQLPGGQAELRFSENRRRTLVRSRDGKMMQAEGAFIVDASNGRIVGFEVVLQQHDSDLRSAAERSSSARSRIQCRSRLPPTTGWVYGCRPPCATRWPLLKDAAGQRRSVTGEARYDGYRRFEATGRIIR